jgi:hypothetical protein
MINQTIADWAQITVERWEEKITQLGIGISGTLINSFTHQILTDSKGDPELIRFTFEYYGKMVEMGVGKGVPLAEVQNSNRKPKQWYSKTFAREMYKLSEHIAKAYGQRAVTLIVQEITQQK